MLLTVAFIRNKSELCLFRVVQIIQEMYAMEEREADQYVSYYVAELEVGEGQVYGKKCNGSFRTKRPASRLDHIIFFVFYII